MEQVETPRELLKIAEAARALGVCPKTVHRLIYAGDLPSVKIGRRGVRVAASDVRLFIDRNRATTAKDESR